MGLHSALLATGIAGLDEEHRRIFEIIERTRGICSMGKATRCLGCTLATIDCCSGRLDAVTVQLASCLTDHFRHEEDLMDGVVPRSHVLSHCDAHGAVFAQVDVLLDQFARERNPARTAHDLAALLDNWLHEHTRRYDCVLASYLGDDADEMRAA